MKTKEIDSEVELFKKELKELLKKYNVGISESDTKCHNYLK
jgi:hypothetical protein